MVVSAVVALVVADVAGVVVVVAELGFGAGAPIVCLF